MSEQTQSLVPVTLDAVEVYTSGAMDTVLDGIRAQCKDAPTDTSTVTKRKEVASWAYRVAQSKTLLDKLGADLVADQKRTIAKVDAERRRMREELDALKTEVRRPLTEWEQADSECSAKLDQVRAMATADYENSAAIAGVKQKVEACTYVPPGHRVDEWQTAVHDTMQRLSERLSAAQQREEDARELARLRAEAEERARAEAALAEAQRVEAERLAREKAVAEAERLAHEKAVAEADRDKQRAIEAERAKAAAAVQAERDKAEALRLAELQRLRQEQRAREEQEQREANARHRNAVHAKAAGAIAAAGGISNDAAAKVVAAICARRVPGVSLIY